jgi:16S rRNA (cytosine1402-N4)-methyltransferase
MNPDPSCGLPQTSKMSIGHIPVLLKESVDGLDIKPQGTYVDATYGGGGYSGEILKRLGKGRLFAIDIDEEAASDMPRSENFTFIHGNFRYLKNYLKYYNIDSADGIVADLGVSSHHFDSPERGFTYRSQAPLDMRMNRLSGFTASDIVNNYEAAELTRVFREYGELPNASRITSAIINARKYRPIESSSALTECIRNLAPAVKLNQFLSQVFQALRIEVNKELENLEIFLNDAGTMLKSGGRLVVVSYHSLEDRLVKNYMRWGNVHEEPGKDIYGKRDDKFRIITRKPVVPSENEIMMNPRSRSSRLRIAEKI